MEANSEDARRAREEVLDLEAACLRLSEKVMEGSAEALEEDRLLERRIQELANQRTPGQEEEDRQ